MKKIVQRFALLALMLLPMLTYGQVTVTVNYDLRGSWTSSVDGDYDVITAVPNTHYDISAAEWTDASTGLPIVEDGANIIKVSDKVWKFKNDIDLAVRLKFHPENCAVTTTAANGSITDEDDNPLAATYPYGTQLTIKAEPNAHYSFVEWEDNTTANPRTLFVTDNIDITATFEAEEYTVTIVTVPAAAADEMEFEVNGVTYDPTAKYDYNTNVGITVYDGIHYTGTGAHFELNGSTVGGEYDYTHTGIAENITLTYYPVVAQYALTVTSDDDLAGHVTGAGTFDYNSEQQIEAVADNAGYEFYQWNDGNADNPRTVTVTDNATTNTYTAFFQYKQIALTLAMDPAIADGSFTVNGAAPEATYPFLSELTIEAVDGTNYRFDSWQDNGSTSESRTITLTEPTTLTAVYTAQEFAVSFAANTKLDLTGNGNYTYGATATVNATPFNANEYVFKEWQVGGTQVSTNAEYSFTVEGAVELDAIYEGVEYTINAVTNTGDNSEGSVEPATQTVRFGETYDLTATPATGYEFKTWDEPTLGTLNDEDIVDKALDQSNISHTYTWTASFGPKAVAITLQPADAHFGITYTTASPINTTFGATVAEPEYTSDATKYVITGWQDGDNNDFVFSPISVTAAVTIHPVVDSVAHNLTLTAATIAGDVTSLKYNTTFTLTPTVPAGKSFKNWEVNGAELNEPADYEFTMTNADMAIEAIFQDVVYTVSATADPAGAATFNGTGTDFVYGANTTISFTADEHYDFVEWSDHVTDLTRTVNPIDKDTAFTAVFAPKTYTITVAVNDPVMGTATTSQATAEYNTAIRSFLTATPNPQGGYYLINFTDQHDVVIDGDYKIAEDVVATANFGYSALSITNKIVKYGDTNTLQPTWGSVAVNGVAVYTGEITLTASANEHYNFKGWSDGVNDNPRTFILTRDTIFYAYFAPDTHTVAITVNYENMGSVTGFTATKAAYGTEINIVAEANTAEHYHFVNWSDATTDATHATITIESDTAFQANFAIDQVTITADNTDGFGTFTPATPSTVDYNATVELAATPNHGYKFQKWSNGITDITTNPYELTATVDETWTVSFELDQFTVTAAAVPANAATAFTGAGDYDYLTDVTVGATAATGYVLDHFENVNGDVITMPFSLTDDTTINAVFDSVTVNITAASNNDIWGIATASASSAKYNTTVTLTATPATGYKLVSWSDGTNTYPAVSNDTTFKVPATDVTYTATFAIDQFTVTASANNDVMGTVEGAGEFDYNTSVELTATANAGYQFVNWKDNHDNVITMPFTLTQDTTIIAVFEANTYTLTIAVNEVVRGHVTENDVTVTSKTVTFGEEITLVAVNHTGYEFDKWTKIDGTDAEGATLTFTYNVADNATVTANFKYHMWNVTATGTNNATVTGAGEYANGAEATLTATPAEHYTVWKGWQNAAGDTVATANPLTVTVLSDTVLTALFDVDSHMVSITSNNDTWGTIEGVTNGTYAYGTVLSGVTAVPTGAFSHFVEWSDDNTEVAAHSDITVNADVTLVATFAVNQYDVNVAVATDNTGMGTVTGSATNVDHGTMVTVTATPATGYQFVNWTNDDDNDAEVSTDASYTFELTGNVNYTAHFDYKTYSMDITVPVKEMGYVEVRDENDVVLGADSLNFTVDNLKTHTEYTVVATPKYGYNFANWTGDHTGNDSLFTVNNDDNTDVAYTANFGFNQYTITLTANSDARGTLTGAGTYSYGNVINIAATPEAGFHFDRWDDGNTSNPREIIIREDAAYEAIFVYDPIATSQEGCNEVNWADAAKDFDTTITETGVYTHIFVDALGEDSVVNNTVTVYTPLNTEENVEICFEYHWDVTDMDYTVSDTYTSDFTDANGCEAVHTLNLTIFEQQGQKYTIERCAPYTWDINGVTYPYDENGVYVEYTSPELDANGCEKRDTLDLTFTTPQNVEETVTACDSYTWTLQDGLYENTYDASGDYTIDGYLDQNECTATATLHLTINTLDDVEETASACDSYTWTITSTGETFDYTEGGDKTETITDPVTGCTATATLHLTINHNSSTVFEDVVACDTYEMTWTDSEIETITASNTYTHDYTSVEGCPSTDQVTVTINSSTTGVEDTTVCDTYTWINGETYTESVSGVEYTIANGNNVGCDSTVTLNLTVNYKVEELVEEAACESYSWNGLTLTNSGDYTMNDNGGAANGCDYITTLRLTINQPQEVTLPAVTACDSYVFKGVTYTESQEFTFDTLDINGCDSTTYFSLTINTPQNTTESQIACESYTWDVTGLTYTASDSYTADITDANGCAATATLNLTINNGEDVNVTETACDTYHWDITDQDYTESGDYPVDFNDGNGCAYTATLHLTINNSQVVELPAVTACDSYEFNGQTYTASEEITVAGTGANGCDSTITLSLTINNSKTVALDAVTACDSYEFNGQTYTASEEITIAGTGANGCDSTTTLSLTINQAQTVALDAVSACDSYIWNGETYTASQELSYTTTGANGCDSTTTLSLTINTPVNTTATEVACDSYTWTVNNQTYTTSGTYTADITDANGCDATATLNLTVNAAQNTTETEVACDSYTWTVNSQSYTTSGIYTAAITDANGCAATATLNLTVNQSVTSSVALSDTGSVVFNDVTYTADTTVTVTFTAANGCDSTVTATITVIPEVIVPDSVTLVLSVNDTTLGMVVPAPGIYNYATTDTVELEAVPFDGNHFTGWSLVYTLGGQTYTDNSFGREYYSVWIMLDVFNQYDIDTVYMVANFAEGPDSLTVVLGVNNDTMGTTNPVPGTYTYAANDTLNFFATANEGYQFVNWNVQYVNAYGNTMTSTFTEDAVGLYASQLYYWGNDTIYVVANFEEDTTSVIDTNTYYYITLMSADTTMGTVSQSDSVVAGMPFAALATANQGYRFVAWLGVDNDTISTENPYLFNATSDLTLIATFTQDSTPVQPDYYTITVNYDSTMGTVTGEGTYLEGTVVTLRATANQGFRFVSWMDGNNNVLTSNNEYTFTLTGDVTFTAQFEAEPVYYHIVGQANDTTMGSVIGSGDYVEGSTVTLTALAYDGYHFVRWSNGETATAISFTVTEDVTLIAYFEADPTGIDDADMANVTIYSAESTIFVRGAEGKTVSVYDINGRTISRQANASENVEFRMTATGVYLVKVGNAPAKRVLVVR